jgi:hypothetical protein
MRQLVKQLQSAGHDVWVDESGIEAGDAWAKEIVTAIRSSQVFVLLATASSVRSTDVKKEVGLAGKFSIPVVPVVVGAVQIPDEISYHISNQHQVTVDTEHTMAGFSRVSTEINDLRPARRPAPSWIGCVVVIAFFIAFFVLVGSTVWTVAAGVFPPWSHRPVCNSVSAEVVAASAIDNVFGSGATIDVAVANNTAGTVNIPSQRAVTARSSSGRQYSPDGSLSDQSWFFGLEIQPDSTAQLQLGLSSATAGIDTVVLAIPDVNEAALPFLKCTVVLPAVQVEFGG